MWLKIFKQGRLLIFYQDIGYMSDPGPSTPYQNNIHAIGNATAWSILLNISVICGALRYDKAAQIAHAIFGLLILFLTFFSVLYLLGPYGFYVTTAEFGNVQYAHAILGCMVLGFVVMQVAGGVIARMFQQNKAMDILWLKRIRAAHRYFGYFLAILYKIDLLYEFYGSTIIEPFAVLLSWEILWILAYILIKVYLYDMQAKIVDPQTVKYICPKVQRISEVTKVTNNYIIFADYVYDAKDLEETHPGGYKVIRLIKGREVDRFIYGMYSAQLMPELPAHAHSAFSLQLVGKPIAKLCTPPTYEGFGSEIIEAVINYKFCISEKTQIFSLGIVPKYDRIRYLGYTDIRQLGQYYSFTIIKKITRIYTSVNFLNSRNISLMNEVLKVQLNSQMMRASMKQPLVETELPKLSQSNRESLRQKLQEDKKEMVADSYIPIMMKVYDTGKLTKGLKSVDFTNTPVQISIPRGRGLDLQATAPGRIIIVAGGTGLYPFSDLIDLLFKSQLIAQGHPRSRELIGRDRVLQTQPFAKFFFVFLIAINQPEDIHPITFAQLVRLSQHEKRVKVVLRVSKNVQKLQAGNRNIEFTRDYFNKRVLIQTSIKGFSRVWICGPPKLNTDTANILLGNGYTSQQFLLI